MFKNYLIIALRNFRKQKSYTIINLTGLAIGMTAVIFILLWVNDELSYDTFHEHADRIYRITQRFDYDSKVLHQTYTPGILAATLMESCPEVEIATRVRKYRNATLVKRGNDSFNENHLGMADEHFFDVFSFDLISGNPVTALKEPYTVILSQSAARKYFGDENPMGQTLNIYEDDFQVSGVYADMPTNSHFHLDMIFSVATIPRYNEANWGINVFHTYAMLKPEAPPEVLQSTLNDIIKKHMFRSAEDYNRTLEKGNMTTMPIQRLTDIHLKSHLLWESEPNGNDTYVRYLSFIAIFILIIALVNYINLATARSAGRAKEVGIRKSIGSSRTSLIWQFITESVLTSFLALLLTIGLILFLFPYFREIVGKPWLNLSVLSTPGRIVSLLSFVLLSGIISGIYPALALSSFRPIAVLSGKLSGGVKHSALRNGLVVFQFSMSIILLIGSSVVRQQMNYSQTKNLGFDRQQVLVIKTFGEIGEKIETIKETLKTNPAIIDVSASTSVPGYSFNNLGMRLEGSTNWSGTNIYSVDADFLNVMQMKMVQGRFFSRDIASDERAVVINESKALELGLSEHESKELWIWSGRNLGNQLYQIIGIVKDFHYESFHEPVKPMVMIMLPGITQWPEDYLSIRLASDEIPATMQSIENIWKKILPKVPFEYSFMDSIYDDLYRNEQRTGKIFSIFTFLALLVACMGLIGLTSFVTEQRRKEIGIRKVLGASLNGLVLSLCGEFTRWVLLANLLAWPLAYFWMTSWLQDFAYRVDIKPGSFVMATLLALLISVFTVSIQSIRAARANPVDSLKYE